MLDTNYLYYGDNLDVLRRKTGRAGIGANKLQFSAKYESCEW